MRAAAFFVAASLLAGVASPAWGSSGAADAGVEAGWWSLTNLAAIEHTIPVPPPPDVPAKGLLVEGGLRSAAGASNEGALAFSAVVFTFAPGSSAQRLSLTVAPASVTTPAAKLELCRLINPAIIVEYGGPLTHSPTFNCARNVTAAPSGNRYVFDVRSLMTEGALAVAVLPTSVTDRVVLQPPTPASLTISSRSPGTHPPTSPQATPAPSGGAGVTGESAEASPAPADSETQPAITAPDSETPAAAPAPQFAPEPTVEMADQQTQGAQRGGANSLAVALLAIVLVAGGLLWAAAGRAAVSAISTQVEKI